MLKINYCKRGHAYPDYICEEYVRNAYETMNNNDTIETSTLLIIDAVRVLIYEKVIDHNLVEFYLEDEYIGKPDKYGRIDNWPKGFCDYHEDMLDRMLDLGVNNKKGE